MKPLHILLLLLAFAAGPNTRATVYSTSVENIFAPIPDGDLNGIQSSQTLSLLSGTVSDVNVTLTVSGGFNGDFYAYLFHNNTSAILLNRVGRGSSSDVGYPDAGFGPNPAIRFTFDDQAAHDVHLYQTFSFVLNSNGQLTGTWQPDGRAIDPLSPASAFDSAARLSLLGMFNGMDPNGSWTLFIADVSPLGQGTLVNWGLQLTTVPEPGSALLLGLGLVLKLIGAAYTDMKDRVHSGVATRESLPCEWKKA
jgi:subtilisin-like proprotein convertase family protein